MAYQRPHAGCKRLPLGHKRRISRKQDILQGSIAVTSSIESSSHPHPSCRARPPRPVQAANHIGDVLDVADRLMARDPSLGRYPGLPQALPEALRGPSYRRTFVQGCACATGIAGGGCCPGAAMGSASQAGASMSSGASVGMAPAGWVTGALGAYGVVTGLGVTRNAYDAMQQLGAVKNDRLPRHMHARLWHTRLRKQPRFAVARAAAAAYEQVVRAELRDLNASLGEQAFNLAVPGVLQTSAASATTLSAVGHWGHGCGASACGAGVGAAGPALFALYGGAMAAKNFKAYADANKFQRFSAEGNVDDIYREAINAHIQATRQNKWRTGLAWSAVCAAGILGALVASGTVAFAGALPVVLAMALLSGGWAMWENSRTRYVPHLPVSEHVERTALDTTQKRAQSWMFLRAQDTAIKEAVAALHAVQTRWTQLHFHVQRLFRPQCGPKAFTVLADRVARGVGRPADDPAACKRHYDSVQILAARTWCAQERGLLEARLGDRAMALRERHQEVQARSTTCCVKIGGQLESIYSDVVAALGQDADALERAARRLLILDRLGKALESLPEHAGDLRLPAAGPVTEAQNTWVYARLCLLALSNTMGDAVSQAFMKENESYFSKLATPEALPLNHLYVLPDALPAFAHSLARQLDGAFVHAFFNPRRIEAEMDFVMEIELKSASNDAAAEGAPKCDSGTCCR